MGVQKTRETILPRRTHAYRMAVSIVLLLTVVQDAVVDLLVSAERWCVCTGWNAARVYVPSDWSPVAMRPSTQSPEETKQREKSEREREAPPPGQFYE